MNKKQIVALIICAIMLLTCCAMLVGCNDPYSEEIHAHIQKEILDDFNSASRLPYLVEDFGLLYLSYGMVNGYAVYFVGSNFDEYRRLIVADKYSFSYSNYFLINLYKDGETIWLEDAYEQGLISEDDVRIIWERFWEVGPILPLNPFPNGGTPKE